MGDAVGIKEEKPTGDDGEAEAQDAENSDGVSHDVITLAEHARYCLIAHPDHTCFSVPGDRLQEIDWICCSCHKEERGRRASIRFRKT